MTREEREGSQGKRRMRRARRWPCSSSQMAVYALLGGAAVSAAFFSAAYASARWRASKPEKTVL